MADIDTLFDSLPDQSVDDAFDALPSNASQEPIPSDISNTEALLRGASSGLTFGASPKIFAALDALSSAGKSTPLLDSYRQALKQREAEENAAAAQHPILYHGSQIAGGLALPLGELKLLKGAGVLPEALQEGGNLARLGGVAESAATGAAIGGTAGALGAQTGEDILSQAAKGATGGAAIGGGLGAIGAGIGAGAEALAAGNSPLAGIAQNFVSGSERGVNLLNVQKISNETNEAFSQFASEELAGRAQKVTDNINKVLNKARADQTPISEDLVEKLRDQASNLEDLANSSKDAKSIPQIKDLVDQLNDAIDGVAAPVEKFLLQLNKKKFQKYKVHKLN
jgi:hypothetical protein